MELLEKMILECGELRDGGILKVDSFLNHQIDIELMIEIGKEFSKLFADKKVNKILTIEASGIAIASITAQFFGNVPVVFAKKSRAATQVGSMFLQKRPNLSISAVMFIQPISIHIRKIRITQPELIKNT